MPPVHRCGKCNTPMRYNGFDIWADLREERWECPKCKSQYMLYPWKLPFRYRVFFSILGIMDHNERDYIMYHLFGLEFRACARCLGAYVSGLISFIIFGYLYYINLQLPFYPVFVISVLFGSFTLIDYATIDIFHIRKGNNRIRMITGVFLGIGAMLYFWLLPTDWWFRMITLLFYNLLAILVAYVSMRMYRSDGEAQVGFGERGETS